MPNLRKKIPPGVIADLHWWNSLLPTYNGVLYFEEDRENIQLNTDASLKGLGGFYFQKDIACWNDATPFIDQKHAFAAVIDDTNRMHINVQVLNQESIYHHINKRFIYGELRLGRLNAVFRFTGLSLLRDYQTGYSQYSSFFRENFTWLASINSQNQVYGISAIFVSIISQSFRC